MFFPQIMANNSYQGSNFFAALHCILLGYNAFIASFLCLEGKQGIKIKAEAIKCCKENKITAPSNEWSNIPFCLSIAVSCLYTFHSYSRPDISIFLYLSVWNLSLYLDINFISEEQCMDEMVQLAARSLLILSVNSQSLGLIQRWVQWQQWQYIQLLYKLWY